MGGATWHGAEKKDKALKKRGTASRQGLSVAERKTLTADQLSIDRQRLLIRFPFVGSVLMRLELVPVHDGRLDTSSADGDHIFVDLDFYASLSDEERLFVLAHEAWHCAMLHFARRQNRKRELFDLATDIEIHFILRQAELPTPFVPRHDKSWKDLSAEEIYERICADRLSPAGTAEDRTRRDGDDLRRSGCERNPGLEPARESAAILKRPDGWGFDRHAYSGEGGGHAHMDVDVLPGREDIGLDPDYTAGIASGAEERCRERLVSAVLQYQRMIGELPGQLECSIKPLLRPTIDWRRLLAQFVTSCYGGSRRWLPPSRRRLWQGIYLPSSRQECLRAVVVLDTSGSTMRDAKRFLTELAQLLKSFGEHQLTVMQCDAQVQEVWDYDSRSDLSDDSQWMVKGGGGTDYRPAFDWIERELAYEPSLLIYFTDGKGIYPRVAPSYPVMWMLTADGTCQVDWGMKAEFSS